MGVGWQSMCCRYPSAEFDPMTTWDDVVRGRELFVHQLRDDLDSAAAPLPALDAINEVEMEMYERACDSSRRQGNFTLSYECVQCLVATLRRACAAQCVHSVVHLCGVVAWVAQLLEGYEQARQGTVPRALLACTTM